MKKLSDATYWIEQLKGRRHRKVVHFDTLKLCPKNIRLDDEPATEQGMSFLEPTMSTETCLLIGHDLQIVDNDDDYIDNGIVRTPNAKADTSAPVEPAVFSASRYP